MDMLRTTVENKKLTVYLSGSLDGTNAAEIGRRLDLLCGGGEVSPRALGLRAEGDALIVSLSAPVRTGDGEAPALLEIAGEDGCFAPARAEICGRELVLRAEGIEKPVRARYAWIDWSDRVNLFGENGLPLEPFELTFGKSCRL